MLLYTIPDIFEKEIRISYADMNKIQYLYHLSEL
jgi:hypothetical protein